MRNKDGLQLGNKGGVTMWIGIRKAPDDPNIDALRQQLKRLMQGSKATDMQQRIQHMLSMGMGREQNELELEQCLVSRLPVRPVYWHKHPRPPPAACPSPVSEFAMHCRPNRDGRDETAGTQRRDRGE